MSTVTLLGPQIHNPNLREVLRGMALQGPFVAISAGWQEREGELDELRTHVAQDVHDLRVYERTEAIFADDQPLRIAHRTRQAELQELQELYQPRLRHAKDAARELLSRDGTPALLRRARRQALAMLRRLDATHLADIRRIHAAHLAALEPATRPAVQAAERQIKRYVDQANAVLIAGGHVAVLLNRLRLLGGAAMFGNKPVIAWSAGAMALAEAVVLFHDQPPQGQANTEVFEAGLGVVRRVIPLPHAQSRLHLHDAMRVELMARRFAPNACITLDQGAWLHFVDGQLQNHGGCFQLARNGALTEVAA